LPTHLVVNGVAHRIEIEPMILGPAGIEERPDPDQPYPSVRRFAGQAVLEAPAEAGATINGETIEGRTALAPGDRLRLGSGDREILVVSMAD
jgi:hypothetical protein